MHFWHPVHAGASICSPVRRKSIAPGGQSGTQRPHSSHRSRATTATRREVARTIARDVTKMP